MSVESRAILKSENYEDVEEFVLEFHLTYEGPLNATQNDPQNNQRDRRARQKHLIRQRFHAQLKQLWETSTFLRHAMVASDLKSFMPEDGMRFGPNQEFSLLEVMTGRYPSLGFKWVPLVDPAFFLNCSLEILFLRHDQHALVSSGDIDNRLKTLLDALRIPKNSAEITDNQNSTFIPQEGETPFFCLLQDDSLITHLQVETGRLLAPSDQGDVKLIIRVKIWPFHVTKFNLNFA